MVNINLDLVVPVVIVFVVIRLQPTVNIPHYILHGLRLFVHKRSIAAAAKIDDSPEEAAVVNSLDKLELSMIETSSSPETTRLLTNQLFYSIYEIMINLSVCSLLAYCWSMAFHCAYPSNLEFSCWNSLLLIFTAVFCFQSQLQVLFLTGFQARESILALQVGSLVFFLTMISLNFNLLPLYSTETVYEIAVHVNALFAQVSAQPLQLHNDTMVRLIAMGLSVVTSFMTIGMVIPAVRFSQTFHTMNFGSAYQLAPLKTRLLLGIDFILPLYVAVLYSPLPNLLNKFKVFTPGSTDHNYHTCAVDDKECNTSAVFENALMVVQLVLVVLTVGLRLFCLRKHLQCFLDTLVKVVSMQIFSRDDSFAQLSMLHAKVKARTHYLVAAAAQYLAVPIFLMTLVLLMHKASPTGTGVCAVVRGLAKLDNSQLANTIYTASHTNTSAVAFEKASQPYLSDALQALVGVIVKVVPGDKITFDPSPSAGRSTVPMQAFLLKMSDVYTLPASTAVSLAKSLICVHSLLWFVLNLLGLLAWMYYPQCFVAVPPVPPPQPAAAATSEAATSAETKKNE